MSKQIVVAQTFKVEPMLEEKKQRRRRRWDRRGWVIFLAISVMLFVVGGFVVAFVLIPGQHIYASAQRMKQTAESFAADLGGKDLTKIDGYVQSIQTELDLINQELSRYEFLDNLELTKGYYQNLQVVREMTQQTDELLESALPDLKGVLNSLGYKTESAVAVKPVKDEDKLKTLVKELPKLVKLYDKIEPQLIALLATYNRLDANYIPSVGLGNYKDMVINSQDLTKEFPTVSAKLKDTIKALPDLLGSSKPARYLIIFQNDKEMRSAGGIMSAFGTLTIDKGELDDDIKTTDLWDLENYVAQVYGDIGLRNIYGQLLLMQRGCGSAHLRAQDSGIYPDLFWTMETFRQYYDRANKLNKSRFPDYDHIVVLNTFFAGDMISLIQPLKVDGQSLTSSNVADKIFATSSGLQPGEDRDKGFVGRVATAVQGKFNKLPADKFPEVVNKIIYTIQAKSIAFYSKTTKIQSFFDQFGMSGRIEKNFSGDYFNLAEAQICGLKANTYITNKVTHEVRIDSKGKVKKEVTVRWTNDHVYDPKKDTGVITNGLRHLYRAWIRFVTPPGTNFTASDGYEKSKYIYRPQVYQDKVLDKAVSDNVIWFDYRRNSSSDPRKHYYLTVNYDVNTKYNYTAEKGYRMLLQKHPGKRKELNTVVIDFGGKKTQVDIELTRDKIVTFKDGVITVDDYDKRLDDYKDLMDKLMGK